MFDSKEMINNIIKFITNVLIGLLSIVAVNYALNLNCDNFWMNCVYAFIGIAVWNDVVGNE